MVLCCANLYFSEGIGRWIDHGLVRLQTPRCLQYVLMPLLGLGQELRNWCRTPGLDVHLEVMSYVQSGA